MPKDKIPTSHQTHPLEFATADDLQLAGLQPADDQKVVALFSGVPPTKLDGVK